MVNLDKSLEALYTSLEKNKKILNPLLNDYLSERIGNKNEYSKKDAFYLSSIHYQLKKKKNIETTYTM